MGSGPDALLPERARFEVGVARLLGPKLGQALVVQMEQRLDQRSGPAVEYGDLVNQVRLVVAGPVPAQQSELAVGPPTGVANPAPTDQVPTRDPEGRQIGMRRNRPANLVGQRGDDPLVGVDVQQPVGRGEPERGVALVGEADEGQDVDVLGVAARDLGRGVTAGRVDDDEQLVDPADAAQAAVEERGFGEREDRRADGGARGRAQKPTSTQTPPTLSSWKAIPSWISPA